MRVWCAILFEGRFEMGKKIMVVLFCLAVAGVSAGGGRQNSGKTLSFYMWDESQKAAMQKVVDGYTKASGVKVEVTVIPYSQYWTKLQTSLPSENGPDVFLCNYSHAIDYYPAGLAQEIQSYIDRDHLDMAPFPAALREMYSSNGKAYGIPKDYDTIALFYNKALFNAKGQRFPTNDWTWDDFQRAAIALTDRAAGNYGFAVWATEQEVVYPFIATNDGTVLSQDGRTFSFSNPRAIETLQWLVDLALVHHASPTLAELKELNQRERFLAGKLAMVTSGSWDVKDFYEAFGDDLGIVQIPIKRREGNTIHGLSFNISAKSRNKEEAWGLLKAFATKEAGEAQAQAVIPAYEGATQVWKNNYPKLDLQVFIDSATQFADPYATPKVAASAQFSAMYTMFEKILSGADVRQACAELDAECARIAAESGR
jgi:multiple sugar transport system substrate-binding protein